jgi:hypothetical protein
MNKIQKIILAIFVPVILYVIALVIAEPITWIPGEFHISDSSDVVFNYGWPVWLVFLIIVCIFEYKLFKDKDKRVKK